MIDDEFHSLILFAAMNKHRIMMAMHQQVSSNAIYLIAPLIEFIVLQ